LSNFLSTGKLPDVCIHTPIEDAYSEYFLPRITCDCGSVDWMDGELKVIKDSFGYEFPKKPVHRCKSCNEIRLADLKLEQKV